MGSWKDQYNYALKTALNQTAVDAQSAIRAKMHSEFTIRNKYADNSIKVEFAKKDNLQSAVKVQPPKGGKDILSIHEEGGIRTNQTGGMLAVAQKAIRPTPTATIPQSKLPRNLKRAFKIIGKDGKEYLLVRKGKGKNNVKLAYRLIKSAPIKADLHFYITAVKTVQAKWHENCEAAIQKAILTAHPQ